MSLKICTLLQFLLCIEWVSGQTSINELIEHCIAVDNETRVGFPGWSFQLDCDGMVDTVEYDNSSPNQCHVATNGSLHNSSSIELRINSPQFFNVFLIDHSNGSCWKRNINIELRSLATSSFAFRNINDDYLNNKNVEYERVFVGNLLTFECVPPSSIAGGPPHKLALPPTFNSTWWRTQRFKNGTLSSQMVWTNAQDPIMRNYTDFALNLPSAFVNDDFPNPKKILKYGANFFDPALYSCEVQHNGETAFITHQSICIKNPVRDSSAPTVMCTELHIFEVGQSPTIQCSVFSSNEAIEPGQLVVEWRREENDHPECTYRHQTAQFPPPYDPRFFCSVEGFTNLSPVCFNYVPHHSEIKAHPDRKDFMITLSIRDVAINDEGRYFVRVTYKNKTSEDASFNLELSSPPTTNIPSKETLFTLESNTAPATNLPSNDTFSTLESNVDESSIFVLIAVSTVVAVVVVIVVILIWYFWKDYIMDLIFDRGLEHLR